MNVHFLLKLKMGENIDSVFIVNDLIFIENDCIMFNKFKKSTKRDWKCLDLVRYIAFLILLS